MLKLYKRIPKILAISFDLDDTLYDNVPIIGRAEQKLNQYLAERFPPFSALESKDWQAKKNQFIEQNKTLAHDVSLLRKRFLASQLAEIGVNNAKQQALQAYEYFHQHRNNFSVSNDCINVLLQLKQKVPLIAITNGNAEPDLIGLSGIFDLVLRPQNELLMKPDSAIFEYAARQLKIAPKHVLHLGDSYTTDVYGALNANMLAGWFNPRLLSYPGKVLPNFEYSKTDDLLCLFD